MKSDTDILELWASIHKSGAKAILATIVELSGSHYRHPGARMLLCADGRRAGAVSGGCLVAELARQIDAIAETGQARLVQYDTSTDDDIVLGTGMGCGGTVTFLLEPAGSVNVRFMMTVLENLRAGGEPALLATVYEITEAAKTCLGERVLLTAGNVLSGTLADKQLRDLALKDSAELPSARRYQNVSWQTSTATAKALIERIRPSTRLAIFGAGDDAIPVFRMAFGMGWQVTIVDPRPEYASAQRFPGAVGVMVAHPEELEALFTSNRFDAALIMTHNYHRDLALLKRLLSGDIGYVGLLGARSRVGRMLNDLSNAGIKLDPREPSRLYAPVGLSIGAESSEEIALAIIAEIQKVLSESSGRSLRDESGTGIPLTGIVHQSHR